MVCRVSSTLLWMYERISGTWVSLREVLLIGGSYFLRFYPARFERDIGDPGGNFQRLDLLHLFYCGGSSFYKVVGIVVNRVNCLLADGIPELFEFRIDAVHPL